MSKKKKKPSTEVKAKSKNPVTKPAIYASVYDSVIPLGSWVLPFNGEKNLNEIGPIIKWIPDYYALGQRSWQSYLETPLSKTIVEKWTGWIIDTGLKLKANPARLVLESEGITMSKADSEKFNDTVESRWDVWSKSKNSSWSGDEDFAETTKSVYLNSKVGGDILVVLRYENNTVKIQKIDGQKVQNPLTIPGNLNPETGNFISNGVEVTPTGRIHGYYVKTKELNFEFISAYSDSTGLRTAFLVKGSHWRMDYHRGLPIISTVLESLKKIDRYQEATIASAEEVAKIAYQVVHQNFSDGSSPLMNNLAISAGFADEDELPVDALGDALAARVAATTNKQAFNNPKGAKIETVNQSTNLTGFPEFYSSFSHIICAAIGIPPNVALSIYNDSFSASRAATKDWDHTMDVERHFFTSQYYNYIYKFWLYTEILKNKVQAKGYLSAFSRGDFMITESYENARFTGPHFPHIDPLKEVNAERAKLGVLGANAPLTTVEQSTEVLGGGDSDSNAVQFAEELSNLKDLGVVMEVVQTVVPADNSNTTP